MNQLLNVYDKLVEISFYYLQRSIQIKPYITITHISYRCIEQNYGDEITTFTRTIERDFIHINHYESCCYIQNIPIQYSMNMDGSEYEPSFEDMYIVKPNLSLSKVDYQEFNNLFHNYKYLLGNDPILHDMWGNHYKYIKNIWNFVSIRNYDFVEYFNEEMYQESEYYHIPQCLIDCFTYKPLDIEPIPRVIVDWLEEHYSQNTEFNMETYNIHREQFVEQYYDYLYQEYNQQQYALEQNFNHEFANTFFNDIYEMNDDNYEIHDIEYQSEDDIYDSDG